MHGQTARRTVRHFGYDYDYGPTVVGLSLGSACLLRVHRGRADNRRVYEVELAPRSA